MLEATLPSLSSNETAPVVESIRARGWRIISDALVALQSQVLRVANLPNVAGLRVYARAPSIRAFALPCVGHGRLPLLPALLGSLLVLLCFSVFVDLRRGADLVSATSVAASSAPLPSPSLGMSSCSPNVVFLDI